jgi:ribulose-5-phosphate 4-epimerase/fuculose-1-phosphate aldolase
MRWLSPLQQVLFIKPWEVYQVTAQGSLGHNAKGTRNLMEGETVKDVPDSVLREFLAVCHKAAGRGLMRCSSGNLSLRLDAERLLATGTRSWMEDISAEQVSVCRIADGALLGGPNPTVEIGFHTAILAARPDVNLVMHFQTPCATALACQDSGDLNFFVIPEIPFYIGPIARVPYLLPGSRELADAVASAMRDHDLVIMSNHGLVTVAADSAHLIQNAEFFELACEVILHGKDKLRPLPTEAVRTLRALRQTAAGGA